MITLQVQVRDRSTVSPTKLASTVDHGAVCAKYQSKHRIVLTVELQYLIGGTRRQKGAVTVLEEKAGVVGGLIGHY